MDRAPLFPAPFMGEGDREQGQPNQRKALEWAGQAPALADLRIRMQDVHRGRGHSA